jgi:hypothetical protein
MDEAERLALEREVQIHLGRVEELLAHLKELQEIAEQSDPPPKDVANEIKSIRMELRGRMAAIAMGESRLGVDPF